MTHPCSDRSRNDLQLLLVALAAVLIASSSTSCSKSEPTRDPLRISWNDGGRSVARERAAPASNAVAPVPESDTSRDERPLQGPVEEPPTTSAATTGCVSASCHESMAASAKIHDRVSARTCDWCHRPTGEPEAHRFELVADDAGICRTCHPAHVSGRFAHEPFVEGGCIACHDPHEPSARGRIAERSATACGTCHEPDDRAQAHRGHPDTPCLSCHAPHESEHVYLTRERSRELCVSCHREEISRADGKGLVSAVGAWIDAAKFLHGPIRDGHCDGCHVAHDSERPSLLRGAYPADFYAPYRDSHYELCFGCHDLKLASEERTEEHTGFRDGNRNLHFLHVNSEKGRSCRACHEVHGSDRPFHIRRSVPFGDFDWELPIEFHATENGGTCTASCHQSASYDRRAAIGG